MAFNSAAYRNNLMRGRLKVKTKPSSNIVRVFVSSTFADMSDERNVLYNTAYPELRNFCQNLGIEFQVIDMRWGVRDTASVDHSTTALCLLEVRTCRKVSLGPYFVVFFGNRYGYQPMPSAVPETEFRILQEIAKEGQMDESGLLEKWYKLDANSIPPARILEPITEHFPHYDDTDPEFVEQRGEARGQWEKTFREISTILRDAAEIAVKIGLLSPDMKTRFSKSITHMEIDEAMKERTESALFAYSREISDLHKYMNDRNAKTFIDTVEGGSKIDKERQKMLKTLKKSVRSHTQEKKMFKRYDISWKHLDGARNRSAAESQDDTYLATFCEDFMSDMKKSIVHCLDQKERQGKIEASGDALLEEVIHHARFEVLKTGDFCGRERLIGEVTQLIQDAHQPIILAGKSGCGKTSLMAKLIEKQRNINPNSVIVYRFLGTSPDSSNIHKLLTSLIYQISTAFGEQLPPQHLLQSIADVVERFAKLIQNVSKHLHDERLMVFLDAIDQLSVEDGAHRMAWLPKTTPEGVSIIISSLPEPDFDIVPSLRRYIPESNFRTVHGLTAETAREILQKCLKSEGRQLTASQADKILENFEKSPFPLFLKLMLEEAKRWRSHDNIEGLILPETSRSAISRFYERLEKEHGKTFVSRAIGFIVAARDGVTEIELQDLLSLDNDVLHDVYEHWSPPTKDTVRIPSFTWTRLNYDLSKYLVQRQATGHTVLALYHRQFIEVARQRYLKSLDVRSVYGILNEYFLGQFSEGTPKCLKLQMWEEPKEVNRRVSRQPLQLSNNVFNVRKLRELPFCLVKAKSFEQLKWKVLANPEWILTKIIAFSIKEVIEDYNLALKEQKDIEVRLIRDAIKLAKPTLEFPGVRNHLFIELFCRLKFFTKRFPAYIGPLVVRCAELLEQNEKEMILPLSGYFQPPGGPLRTTITGFKTPVTSLRFSHSGSIFAAGSRDGSLMVLDAVNDEVLHELEAHSDATTCIAFIESEAGDKVASCSVDASVKMFYLDNGNQCFNETMQELKMTSFSELFLTHEQLLCIADFKVKAWNTSSKEQVFEKQFERRVKCATFAYNTNCVFVGLDGGKCISFDIRSGEERVSCQIHDKSVARIFVIKDADSLMILVGEDGKVSTVNAETLDLYETTESSEGEVIDATMSKHGSDIALAFSHAMKVYTVEGRKLKLKCSRKDKSEAIRKVRFVNKETLSVAYENKKVVLWNVSGSEARQAAIWEGTGAPIDHLEIGQNVGVTASYKMFYLKVWDLDDENSVQLDPTLPLSRYCCALSSSGKLLAYLEGRKVVVQAVNSVIKDFGSKTKYIVTDFHAQKLKVMRFAGEGDILLVLKDDGSLVKIRAEERGDGETQFQIESPEITPTKPHETPLNMCVSNDGKLVLVLHQNEIDYFVRLFGAHSLELVFSIQLKKDEIEGKISSMCPVGKVSILIGSSKGFIYVIEKSDGDQKPFNKTMVSCKHNNAITCLAVDQQGNLIFSGSKGRTRRLWELKNNALIMKHELHFASLLESGVTCAQFTHDSKYLVAGSNERSITIWEVKTGVLIASQYVYAPVLDVVITDNSKLVYTSELGYVAVAKFRPPSVTSVHSVKPRRNQSKSSSACRIM